MSFVSDVLNLLSVLSNPDCRNQACKEKLKEPVHNMIKVCIENALDHKVILKAKDEKCNFKSILTSVLFSGLSAGKEKYTEACTLDKEVSLYNIEQDLNWTFVVWHLAVLSCLHITISQAQKQYEEEMKTCSKNWNPNSAPPISPETLSNAQQKIVLTSAQFIVGLGILPCFLSGVGVPMQKRSHSGIKLLENYEISSQPERNWRLLFCVKVLLSVAEQPSLGALILSMHLGDIMATLLQIYHTWSLKTPSQVAVYAVKNMDESTRIVTNSDAEFSAKELDKLVIKVYPPLIVKELLILQGSRIPSKKTPGKMAFTAPTWLRNACGKYLSSILMRPKGVQYILRGMLFEQSSGGNESSINWKQCEAIGKIIAHCPKHCLSTDEYYKAVGPQVLELLQLKDENLQRLYLQVVCSTISAVLQCNQESAIKYFLNEIFAPFLICFDTDLLSSSTIDNNTFVQCLQNVHKVFVCGTDVNNILLMKLEEVSHPIFKIYCAFSKTVDGSLKTCVEEILSTILKRSSNALSLVKSFAFQDKNGDVNMPLLDPDVQFSISVKGDLHVEASVNTTKNWEERIVALVALLDKANNDDLSANLFIYLLQELSEILSKEIDESQRDLMTSVLENIFYKEQPEKQIERHLILLSLLANMCEKLGHTCFKSTSHILKFVKATLERCVKVLQYTTDVELSIFESETVTMAMGLLTAVLSGASQVSQQDREETKQLLPLLELLRTNHPDATVKEMAVDLKIAIATHGFVLSELLLKPADERFKESNQAEMLGNNIGSLDLTGEGKEEKCQSDTQQPKKQKLIEVLSSTNNSDSQFETDKHENKDHSDHVKDDHKETEQKSTVYSKEYSTSHSSETPTAELDKAFQELLDPLIPVRGHALISLKRLLEQKDPEALQRKDILLKIFKENLDHTDSYIYLSAINGLAVLAETIPEQLISTLAQEYSNCHARKVTPVKVSDKSPELRMKLGEVLMKTIKALGDLIPHYRDTLLSSVLSGALDSDPLVRASAVSNLGELCKLLKFSLGRIIYEVLSCVTSLLKTDPNVEVRRAAAMFITLLLKGLGEEALKVLDAAMKDLYKLLKQVAIVEKDEVVHLHLELAFEELDIIMKKFFFPKQTLTKKIHVIDFPS